MTPPAERAEASMAAWDSHVDGCGACLSQGMHLCYEGTYLADRATELHVAAEVAAARSERGSLGGPLRGLFLPGVPA